jgi:hypothetical protein
MTKRLKVNNVPDIKNSDGMWLRSYGKYGIEYRTRAGLLWNSILARCKVGGSVQKRLPSCVGSSNGFKDFQEFTTWATLQHGYLHKDVNGKFWQLDKDLSIFGNKIYSAETCIFVPHRINTLLTTPFSVETNYPIGVYWDKTECKFISKCRDGNGGGQVYLGSFDCKSEAHKAWQSFKSQVIQNFIIEDEDVKNHPLLVSVLDTHLKRIRADLQSNRETTR